jgi:LysM repeat protein
VVQPGGPGPGPVAAPVTQTFKYVVQPTDVLGDIALRFRTTIEAIMALNPQIKNKNIIIDGDTLLIPKV